MSKIVFVFGMPYSGTTLTATILGANDKAFVIPWECGAYAKSNIDHLRPIFIKQVPLIDADFVIEKTPHHVFSVKQMHEDFPDAKFIVVIRNPIDSIASSFKRSKNFNLSLYECSDHLSGCINAMQYGNTFMIRYEDIVTDFNKTILELCNFIGLEFQDSMINFHENSPNWFEKFDGEHFKIRAMQMKQPLFNDIGNGIKTFSREQVEQIELDCMDKYKKLEEIDRLLRTKRDLKVI